MIKHILLLPQLLFTCSNEPCSVIKRFIFYFQPTTCFEICVIIIRDHYEYPADVSWNSFLCHLWITLFPLSWDPNWRRWEECGGTLGVLIHMFWCRTDNTNMEVIYSRWKGLSKYFTVWLHKFFTVSINGVAWGHMGLWHYRLRLGFFGYSLWDKCVNVQM